MTSYLSEQLSHQRRWREKTGVKAEYRVQNNGLKVENSPQVEAVESRNDEWYSTLKLGEQLVKFKLDTGAKYQIVSVWAW